MIQNLQNINVQKDILLLGIGSNNNHYLNIVMPESKREMREVFGDCDLSDTYDLMYNMGAKNIYVMNLEKKHDYIQAAELIRQYDFAYVVPVDLYISDTYFDPLSKNDSDIYYAETIMELFYKKNNSYVIFTDKHASLYENINDYLNNMDISLIAFKNKFKPNLAAYENIIFVTNNLNNINWANAYLAAMLNISDISEYPSYINSLDINVIFDIDNHDIKTDMAYFKKHKDGIVTIENLLSLDVYNSPTKIVFLFRIQKYIFRDMDYSDVIGSLYTEYQKEVIRQKTIKYLNSYLNWILQSFDLKELYTKEDPNHPGTVRIFIKTGIQPIGCVERYDVVKEIG